MIRAMCNILAFQLEALAEDITIYMLESSGSTCYLKDAQTDDPEEAGKKMKDWG